VRTLGRVALHPVLLAVHPALALWAGNAGEVRPGQVWPTLWLPTVLTLAVWAVAGVLLHGARRGALVAGAATVLALNAGRLGGASARIVAPLVTLVVVAAVVVVARRLGEDRLAPITAVGNVLAVVLVVLTLPAIVPTPGGDGAAAGGAAADGGDGVAGRDIWYVIPDRYPRADTLDEVFGFDNRPFLDHLEGLGFQVADASLANYPKTAHSLAATWNMAPLDELVPTPPTDGADWQPLYDLLGDAELGRVLTGAGYDYSHIGSWWAPTASSVSADTVLRPDGASDEFVSVWRSRTLFAPAPGDGGGGVAEVSFTERNRVFGEFALDQLDRLAAEPSDGPRFVLAHLTLPHPPYAFEADGAPATAAVVADRTREENFVAQLRFTNLRLTQLVDQLTSGPQEDWPVIVIQSDEGPHPAARTGPSYDWTTAPEAVLDEKLRTLSAILLPGTDVVLPEDLTGIDTWRRVLDATIGTDYGPVEAAPVEVFPGEGALYTWVDVRDRVD
jgi:hypothetical protein